MSCFMQLFGITVSIIVTDVIWCNLNTITRTAVPYAQMTTSTERRNTTEAASISPETSVGVSL